jgi:hypothetical protein
MARRPEAPLDQQASQDDPRRARVEAVLRPYAAGTAPGMTSWAITERRVAMTARDAATAVLPLLGEPRRSHHRVRGVIVPLLICAWADFDATFAAVVAALLALPPALPDVEDPAWDAALPVAPVARVATRAHGEIWHPPEIGAETTGPGGTVGRLVRQERRGYLITEDGRTIRLQARCECGLTRRRERPEVPYEVVRVDTEHRLIQVETGTACGVCRSIAH